MAQISQVSMDCQLALLSSATADFSSILFNLFLKNAWEFSCFQQKCELFPVVFVEKQLLHSNHFLRCLCCKNRASWHRDLVVEVLYSHAESVFISKIDTSIKFPQDPKEDPKPSK